MLTVILTAGMQFIYNFYIECKCKHILICTLFILVHSLCVLIHYSSKLSGLTTCYAVEIKTKPVLAVQQQMTGNRTQLLLSSLIPINRLVERIWTDSPETGIVC